MSHNRIEVQPNGDESRRMRLDTHLAEYSFLRNELLEIQRAMTQYATVAFTSIAGVAAALVTFSALGQPEIMAPVYLILPLPFTALLFSYIGHLNEAVNITKYVATHIETSINRVLANGIGEGVDDKVLHWEHFEERRRSRWLTDGIWAGGQVAIMILPTVTALISYYWTISNTSKVIPLWWNLLLAVDIVLFIGSIALGVVPVVRRFAKE